MMNVIYNYDDRPRRSTGSGRRGNSTMKSPKWPTFPWTTTLYTYSPNVSNTTTYTIGTNPFSNVY